MHPPRERKAQTSSHGVCRRRLPTDEHGSALGRPAILSGRHWLACRWLSNSPSPSRKAGGDGNLMNQFKLTAFGHRWTRINTDKGENGPLTVLGLGVAGDPGACAPGYFVWPLTGPTGNAGRGDHVCIRGYLCLSVSICGPKPFRAALCRPYGAWIEGWRNIRGLAPPAILFGP